MGRLFLGRKNRRLVSGLSVIELLVVTAILSLFILAAITAWTTHLKKAQDARRKADLNTIRLALEDYYNDYRRYPPTLDCGQDLSPYLKSVPCDPKTKLKYDYMTTADNPSYYRLYTTLSFTSDPAVVESGCTYGCVCTNGCRCNYGITSPNSYTIPCAFNDWYKCTGPTCNFASGSDQCGPGKSGCYTYGCPGSPCPDPGY